MKSLILKEEISRWESNILYIIININVIESAESVENLRHHESKLTSGGSHTFNLT